MTKVPQAILITQNHLKDYSGAEIVTLELAEYFSLLGSNVTVLSAYIGEPIISDLNNLSNVRTIEWGTKKAASLRASQFDLLWIHHQLITPEIVDELQAMENKNKPKIVFHHMSPFHELEYPIMMHYERAVADLHLFNSRETQEAQQICFEEAKCAVFGNPAPDYYFREKLQLKELRKIAIVSNHPPQELIEAAELLRKEGKVVDIYGRATGIEKKVTPELLSDYECIVTIGKTVQYSILLGIPAYCYDYFGGPGYLNETNFDKARKFNFSGRGYSTKSGSQISADIIENYEKSFNHAKKIQDKYAKSFLLSIKIQEVLKERNKVPTCIVTKAESESFKRYIKYRTELYVKYKEAISAYDKAKVKIQAKENRIHDLERRLSSSNKKIKLSEKIKNKLFNS
jgi:hypothetical protein